MSENTNPTKSTSKGGSSRWIIIALILLALLLGWFYMNKSKEANDLSAEKIELTQELTQLLAEYDAMETDNDSLRAVIQSERARLTAMIDSVINLRNEDVQKLDRFRGEVARLKKMNSRLVSQVDSLSAYSKQLATEKAIVDSAYAQEQVKNADLSTTNEALKKDVEAGSKLQCATVDAMAISRSSSGSENDTQRARRADEIKICYTIAKNPISKKGTRTVYARVETPDNTVVSIPDNLANNVFEINGEQLLYSAKKDVMFEGNRMDDCIYVIKTEKFTKGNYKVTLYTEGYQIGESTFSLK
jgi:hypothetical protein